MYDSRLSHQELQLLECAECFVPTPRGLDLDGGEDRAVGTFEFEDWILGLLDDLGFVGDDLHEFFFSYRFVLGIGHCDQANHIYIAVRDVILRYPPLYLLHNLRDRTPLDDVLSLEL